MLHWQRTPAHRRCNRWYTCLLYTSVIHQIDNDLHDQPCIHIDQELSLIHISELHKFDFTGLAELTEQLCESKVPVYLTIDLDCLVDGHLALAQLFRQDVYKRQA